jgi:hypothetical protein
VAACAARPHARVLLVNPRSRPAARSLQGGFKNLLRQADAIPADVDVDHLFMKHLGYTDPKAPKFELQFDHWLDAMQTVACAL